MNDIDISVRLGRLELKNPILVASGTFGYAREMRNLVDCDRLGGIIPKTITAQSRTGNAPWRTVETSAGLLNSIGLDNDGVDVFLEKHLPYLSEIHTAIIVSIAGKSREEFVALAEKVGSARGVTAIEMNLSCPNVSGGVDYATDPDACRACVRGARDVCDVPILAKLTPNVTRIADIASAAADGGADAVCLTNTVLGMAVDWKKRKPLLGNVMGGLSGPAIKPIALRCVHQVRRATSVPIIGIGGIQSMDDVMEFIVTGASAVQIGTANYYDPTLSQRLVEMLPETIHSAGAKSVEELVGTLVL